MGGRTISRLNFLKLAGGAAGAASVGFLTGSSRAEAAASRPVEETVKRRQEYTGGNQAGGKAGRGRLPARPGPPRSDVSAAAGLYLLGLGSKRDGLLYVPKGYRAGEEAPLALVLHGSMSDARRGIVPFLRPAGRADLILLAPDSRDWRDWDIFFPGHYGPDVRFIDRALEQTFDRFAVDASRLAVMGFSDGASYALSLGLTNGDLFTHVAAFAPGLMMLAVYRGKPSIFVSHGIRDEVLEIDKTSRVCRAASGAQGLCGPLHRVRRPPRGSPQDRRDGRELVCGGPRLKGTLRRRAGGTGRDKLPGRGRAVRPRAPASLTALRQCIIYSLRLSLGSREPCDVPLGEPPATSLHLANKWSAYVCCWVGRKMP